MAGDQPFVLDLSVAGEQQVLRGFSRFTDGVKDMSPALSQIAEEFFGRIMPAQFESQGAYGAGGWAPLSPAYAAWKEANYPGRPILVLSGLMKESLTGGGNAYTIKQIAPLRLEVGTRISYALKHQQGGGRVPQRKIISLTEADKMTFSKSLQAYLVSIAQRAWVPSEAQTVEWLASTV